MRRPRIRVWSFANQYSQTLKSVGCTVVNDLEYLHLKTEKTDSNVVISLTWQPSASYICLCYTQFWENNLHAHRFVSWWSPTTWPSVSMSAVAWPWLVTEAWTPDCFRASISLAVKGWTNCPSLISSFVASVSSVTSSNASKASTKCSYQVPRWEAGELHWPSYC